MNLFRRTLKVGAKFGVVIVLLEGKQVEVATFRTETGYVDGRHPLTVRFASAVEDASRRDFTINGMFYDPLAKKVIDYVNGQEDLKKRLIKTIGMPQERFAEDYLRMLRAVRFSTQLGFKIETNTFSAICRNARKITKISGERTSMELEAILVDPNRSEGVSLLVESCLLEAIFPSLLSVDMKFAIKLLEHLPKRVNFALALAGLFVDCESEFALDKLKILKLSKKQNKHIEFLLVNKGKLLNENMSLAELKMTLAEPYFRDLYELQKAIQMVKCFGKRGTAALIKLRRRIKDLGNVELRPKPLLNGHDLIRLGAIHGPALGLLAEEMYIVQLEGNLQTSEQAQQWVLKWLERHKMSQK